MDSVYFCSERICKDVMKSLKGFICVDGIVMGSSNQKGYFLYAEATPEEMKILEDKLKELGVEKIVGDEEKAIIDAVKTKEENAVSDMRMIFG